MPARTRPSASSTAPSTSSMPTIPASRKRENSRNSRVPPGSSAPREMIYTARSRSSGRIAEVGKVVERCIKVTADGARGLRPYPLIQEQGEQEDRVYDGGRRREEVV